MPSDWWLFKKVGESNLQEAAKLLKADMCIETSLRLLARNSRKRLLIGIGVELLLKAVYLKRGYMINKPPRGSSLKFPFSVEEAADAQLAADETFMLNDLIQNLASVLRLEDKDTTLKGLKIAKVFRNKEGHAVTGVHLSRDAFDERLSVRFSLAPDERAIWRVAFSPGSSVRAQANGAATAASRVAGEARHDHV